MTDPAKDFQTRQNRQNRFLKNSTKDAFLVETMAGAFLFPNEFCTLKSDLFQDVYFCFRREDITRFKGLTFSINRRGFGFSVYFLQGEIFDFYQEIESKTFNAEFIQLKNFEDQMNKSLKSIFQQYFLTTNF